MWERKGLGSSLDTLPRPLTLNTLSGCSMHLKTALLVADSVPAAWTFSPGWGCPGRPHSCVLSHAVLSGLGLSSPLPAALCAPAASERISVFPPQ